MMSITILNLVKDSDFNIEDVTLHEEEELITPELEQLIQKAQLLMMQNQKC